MPVIYPQKILTFINVVIGAVRERLSFQSEKEDFITGTNSDRKAVHNSTTALNNTEVYINGRSREARRRGRE